MASWNHGGRRVDSSRFRSILDIWGIPNFGFDPCDSGDHRVHCIRNYRKKIKCSNQRLREDQSFDFNERSGLSGVRESAAIFRVAISKRRFFGCS